MDHFSGDGTGKIGNERKIVRSERVYCSKNGVFMLYFLKVSSLTDSTANTRDKFLSVQRAWSYLVRDNTEEWRVISVLDISKGF